MRYPRFMLHCGSPALHPAFKNFFHISDHSSHRPRIFLLISAGSTSSCKIFACFANFFALPSTRSLKSARRRRSADRTRSRRGWMSWFRACRASPCRGSFVPSNAPFPIRESHTGASILCTNSLNSRARAGDHSTTADKYIRFSAAFRIICKRLLQDPHPVIVPCL